MHKNLLRVVVLLLLLSRIRTLWAQPPIVLSDSKEFYYHNNAFLYLEDKAHQFSAADLGKKEFLDGFSPAEEKHFNFGLTSSAIWYKFTLVNKTGERWLLKAGNPTVESVTLYIPRLSGAVDSLNINLMQPVSERPWRNNKYLFTLPFPDSAEQVFFLRIESYHSMIVPPKIGTVDSFFVSNHYEDIWAGVYLGLILVMALYNLFIFFSTRDVSYLWYVLYIVFFGLLISMHDAYPFDLFWDKVPRLNNYIELLTCAAGISATMFTICFLDTKTHAPRLHRWFYVVIALYAACALPALLNYTLAAAIVVVPVGFVSTMFVFFTAIYVYKRGYKPAKYYLLAWGVLVVSIIIFILDDIGVLNHYSFVVDPLMFGSVAEALLLSFALADRFNTYRKEKEDLMQRQNELLEKRVDERTVELTRQKQESENLLLNILPAEVAAELKQKGKSDARDYELVTVMFTDFKNFTGLSEKLSPAQLVSQIDYFFSAFDFIIQRYDIEKIKTMGDAYMCAGGLPVANSTHAVDVVKAGIEIRDFMAKYNNLQVARGEDPFEIRIGIHTGPVVAGIVGVKKFAFDIWGDTVNTAARMESSGLEGKVNISGSTYQLVKDRFTCTHRGKIQTKSKGEVDMYFVN